MVASFPALPISPVAARESLGVTPLPAAAGATPDVEESTAGTAVVTTTFAVGPGSTRFLFGCLCRGT